MNTRDTNVNILHFVLCWSEIAPDLAVGGANLSTEFALGAGF